MGGEWETLPLGELTVNYDGRRVPVKEADRRPGPYPYFGASGVVDHVDGFLFDGEYLLIAEDGENLRTRQTSVAFIAEGRFWVNNHAHIVQGNSRATTRFLHYALAATDISGYLTGSTMPKLTQGNMNRIPVVAPPLPEQKRIAHILGTLDDKIELNRRMNATLEGISRAIFKSWFVDFDPVRQKAAGQQPVGMDAQTAALFPDSFEDSEIGEVPKGWSAGVVGDLYDITMGQSPPGDTYNESGDGLPFFQGRADFCFRYPQRRVFCTAPTRFADPGDTLVSVRAPVGDLNMALERCAIGRGVAAVRHKTRAVGFTYYAMHALSSSFDKFEGEGTVFGSMGKKDFHGIKAVAPIEAVIHAFEHANGPVDKQIENVERQAAVLAALRDALLPKLLSGEIRVPEAEQAVEEAVR